MNDTEVPCLYNVVDLLWVIEWADTKSLRELLYLGIYLYKDLCISPAFSVIAPCVQLDVRIVQCTQRFLTQSLLPAVHLILVQEIVYVGLVSLASERFWIANLMT